MKVTTSRLGDEFAVLVDGITIATTDSENELVALEKYFKKKYEGEADERTKQGTKKKNQDA